MTPRRRRSLRLTLAAVAAMLLVIVLAPRHRAACSRRPLPALGASNEGLWLALALTEVPCPGSARAVYRLRDDRGEPVDVLDPIDDPRGASMPALAAVPGASGFLLAYEKSHGRYDGVRVRFYPSRAALLAGRYSASRDLPLRFSRYSNGTPSFLSIEWRGGLARSVITLAFHYETASRGGKPGPDREATGVLRGFRSWSPSR